MNTTYIPAKGKTLMVAHRGLSGIERENTLPAFVAAANRSYFGIAYRARSSEFPKPTTIHSAHSPCLTRTENDREPTFASPIWKNTSASVTVTKRCR